jgi:Glutathione S-transferase, C-terminal domain
VLMKVEATLSEYPGPWFMKGDSPSLVDLTYVPHLERMAASTAYWKVKNVLWTVLHCSSFLHIKYCSSLLHCCMRLLLSTDGILVYERFDKGR